MHAKRKNQSATDRPHKETGLMFLLPFEITHTDERDDEDSVCRCTAAGQEKARDNFQHGHDGHQNKEVESAGQMFQAKGKNPDFRIVSGQC